MSLDWLEHLKAGGPTHQATTHAPTHHLCCYVLLQAQERQSLWWSVCCSCCIPGRRRGYCYVPPRFVS